MIPFAQVPSLTAARLVELHGCNDGFATLKVLIGLSIAKGRYQDVLARESQEFGVTLSALSEICHLSRNDVCSGVRGLVDCKVIARARRPKGALGARKTAFYRFIGERPFIKIPHRHLCDVAFLKNLTRRRANSQLAMVIYLRLCGIRNYRTGESWVTYDTLVEELDVARPGLREAFRVLELSRVVETRRPAHDAEQFHYRQLGVEVDQSSLDYVKPVTLAASEIYRP